MSAKPRIVHPLELPPDLDQKVTEASERMGKTKAETMRIAMHIGLRRLALFDFDPYGAVAVADPPASAPSALKVADKPLGNAASRSTRAGGATGKPEVVYPKKLRRANG